MKKMKEIAKDVALPATLDILGCFGVPTALGQHFYQESVQRRVEAAREILLSEIKEGNFNNVDRDEAVSIAERYQRCAIEGVAKQNLRLMAKTIRGMADKDVLTAPLFTKYSEVLASLTEQEIRCLGELVKTGPKKYDSSPKLSLSSLEACPESIYQSLLRTGLVIFSQEINSALGAPGKNNEVVIDTQTKNVYNSTSMLRELIEYAKSFSGENPAK